MGLYLKRFSNKIFFKTKESDKFSHKVTETLRRSNEKGIKAKMRINNLTFMIRTISFSARVVFYFDNVYLARKF